MKFKYISMLLALTIAITSCKKKEEDPITPTTTKKNPTEGLTLLDEGYAIGAAAKVQLYGIQSFLVGYNPIYVYLTDSITGEVITDAHISFSPIMTMSGSSMMHDTPVENPAGEADSSLFAGSITFVMASSAGTWDVDVHIHNHDNGLSGEFSFEPEVSSGSMTTIKSFTVNDSSSIFVSYRQPMNPVVGVNDFEIGIYKMEMMEFSAEETISVIVDPQMPDMGHGSDNNVNPTHQGEGIYSGKVNFTMTGDWEINLYLSENNEVLDTLYFEVTLN